ncbi:type II toxin-antitoxin system YafQ family toxin [Neisseria chenwenguii]|uniref:Type II toxin-antitoxin system mRNA interferase toxin, RelE/StbE family n=1 Tax=Neisseria chenwenguii TaxID=1853278 RepID=A0A220S1Z9_9NEIS|nr:type II toxin-antitoxin system YafQ family toxin [Neisseria chenwenguii]ASK27509.1 type II toxin-antitoxin system mRNA interferase toxin, RelE/StbE family [Neisseria chenwenguii]ROV55589.1 type II toxin-antitoxin system YafQ family toxin [Neisseria chenwenguii]
MRKIKKSRSFDKDFKKHGLSENLIEALYHLIHEQPLPEKYRDHALAGNFKGYRDCHIRPDLVLIYRLTDDAVELHMLDSHSEIFG